MLIWKHVFSPGKMYIYLLFICFCFPLLRVSRYKNFLGIAKEIFVHVYISPVLYTHTHIYIFYYYVYLFPVIMCQSLKKFPLYCKGNFRICIYISCTVHTHTHIYIGGCVCVCGRRCGSLCVCVQYKRSSTWLSIGRTQNRLEQIRHNAVADILTDNTKQIFVETDTRHVFFSELTCNLLRTLR